jgi:hypothetical protein
MPNFNDYFPQTQGSKMPFSSDMVPCEEFQPLFWKIFSAHKNQEQPELGGNIWSKYILPYLPSTTVVETTVSFKMYHPMKPVKLWLNMFVEHDSTNSYIYNFKSQICKTKNENPNLLKAT